MYDYLVGSGYGEGAEPFGRHYPIASWGYWTKELRLDLSPLALPLAVALLLCFAVALAYAVAGGLTAYPLLRYFQVTATVRVADSKSDASLLVRLGCFWSVSNVAPRLLASIACRSHTLVSHKRAPGRGEL